MSEKRENPRHPVPFIVSVRDDVSGESIGNIADISIHGAQIHGNRAFQPERIYHLSLDLPAEMLGKKKAVLEARCIWSKHDQAMDAHIGGFDFVRRGPLVEGLVSLIYEHQ